MPPNDPRLVPRQSPGMPSERWFGLPKWAVIAIGIVGLIVAYYVYKKSQANNTTTSTDVNPTTDAGLTAADVGGIPQDNSLGTVTDELALEQQIQAMQNSIAQLENSNGGNGAGLQGYHSGQTGGGPIPITNGPPNTPPGGSPGPVPGLPGQGAKTPVGIGGGSNVTNTWTNAVAGGVGPAYPSVPGGIGSVKVPGGRLTQ